MELPAKDWPVVEVEAAREKVKEELERLLLGSPFRVVLLMLSYLGPDGDTHIAHGSALQELDLESAHDFVLMAKSLRQVADQLDALILGKKPDELRIEHVQKKGGP